jgi:hypothetical protein
MSTTSLTLAKSHSNIYFDDKDAELQAKLDAAEEYVAKFLNYEGEMSEFVEAFAIDIDDSPVRLKAVIEALVLEAFDDFWQQKGIFVTGTIVSENPGWLRVAHLYRRNLGV